MKLTGVQLADAEQEPSREVREHAAREHPDDPTTAMKRPRPTTSRTTRDRSRARRGIVLLVGMLACVAPTLRGLRIRPMDALRT